MYAGARADSDSLRAAAFAADVRITDGDAVRIELEHRDGVALELIFPYRRNRLVKKVTFSEQILQEGTRHVWG